jgi:glycosyltransferase involved in cell wall biosynthesis
MNILHVIPYLNPKRGGEVTICTSLAEQCIRRGHTVSIVTTDDEYDGAYLKSLEERGMRVFPFHCTADIRFFLVSPQMKRWLDTAVADFDLVHIHAFRSYQSCVAYRYAMKHEVPYVLQAHGSVLPFFEKHMLKSAYDLLWGRSILRNASKVIAINEIE